MLLQARSYTSNCAAGDGGNMTRGGVASDKVSVEHVAMPTQRSSSEVSNQHESDAHLLVDRNECAHASLSPPQLV